MKWVVTLNGNPDRHVVDGDEFDTADKAIDHVRDVVLKSQRDRRNFRAIPEKDARPGSVMAPAASMQKRKATGG